jgi:hypothetical protein
MKDAQDDHAHEVETAIMTLYRHRDIVGRSVETTRVRCMSAVVVGVIVFQSGGVLANFHLCNYAVLPG